MESSTATALKSILTDPDQVVPGSSIIIKVYTQAIMSTWFLVFLNDLTTFYLGPHIHNYQLIRALPREWRENSFFKERKNGSWLANMNEKLITNDYFLIFYPYQLNFEQLLSISILINSIVKFQCQLQLCQF